MYDCRATATSNKAGRCGRRDEGNHDIDDCVVRCALCVVRCTLVVHDAFSAAALLFSSTTFPPSVVVRFPFFSFL